MTPIASPFSKSAAVLGGLTLAAALATPPAHADDGKIRAYIDRERYGGSECPALEYREDLRQLAYAFARGSRLNPNPYPGTVRGFTGHGDPAAEATFKAVMEAHGVIRDCTYTAYGVSLLRVDEVDTVAIVLGKPNPPVRTLGKNAGDDGPTNLDRSRTDLECVGCNPVPQATPTATVTSDVDVYDAPGGTGTVVGMLRKGDVVAVVKPCPADDWCALADGRFAWGEFLTND